MQVLVRIHWDENPFGHSWSDVALYHNDRSVEHFEVPIDTARSLSEAAAAAQELVVALWGGEQLELPLTD